MPSWLQHLRWRALARSGRPILIGPWRSELGFETLYWLPWLAHWRQTYGVHTDSLIAVSRGGAAVWYQTGQAVELYDYAPLAQIRKAMLADAAAHGSIKQQALTQWEARLLKVMQSDLGVDRPGLLHPSLMYRAFEPWFAGRLGLETVLRELVFVPFPVPVPPLNLALPERYVAVRFYARHTWPMDEAQQHWVATLVDGLAKHLPVVLLESGLHADDHTDFPLSGPNITSIRDHVTPQTNLAVQSAVIAKAEAFVGTYGGTMQLAVRLRKPSVGFYLKFEGTCYAHKLLTEHLAVRQGTPCFIGRPEEARMVKDVLLG